MSKGYLRMEGGDSVGYLTVMELDPNGLAAQSGLLYLGDMVISVNGRPVGALRETTAMLAGSTRVVLELQRLQDETLLGAVLEEVSQAAWAAEQKRKAKVSEAEDVLLQSVLQASRDDHGAHIERATLEEEKQLRLALQASKAEHEQRQEESEVDQIRDEAVLGGVLETSLRSFQRKQQQQQPDAPRRGSAAALAAAGLPPDWSAGGEREARREASIDGAPSKPEAAPRGVDAAAVAKDHEMRGSLCRSVSRPEWLEVQERPRTDSVARVYDAQRRFVLVQEEAADDEDSETFSRNNSEFV